MHVIGPYLNFKRLTSLSNKRSVKRLVHIGLGHCDIILEPAWYRLIQFMDDAKGRIAVLDCINNDTYGKQIIYLIQSLVLIAHFFIDAEKVFYSSVDFTFYASSFNVLSNIFADIFYVFFSLALSLSNLFRKILVNIRFKIFK